MILRTGVFSLLPILGMAYANGCEPHFAPATPEQICSGDVDWQVLGFSPDQIETPAPGELPYARLARGESAELRITGRGRGAGGLCDDWITRTSWRAGDPDVVEVGAHGGTATVTGRRLGQTPLIVEVTLRDGRMSSAELFGTNAAGQQQPLFGIRVVR
jgi:hypothetical protein